MRIQRIIPGSLMAALIAVCALSLAVVPARAGAGETIYATTVNNDLVSFNSEEPCTILSRVRISGLGDDEQILGIDFRPLTGQLYALGSSSRLYVIDLTTGVATAVGTGFTPILSGSHFGFDFNPTVDRIRVVSDTGQNLRLNPVTGATAATDGNLAFATGDINFGVAPHVVGAAYTNPDRDPATGTTLYDIDSALDIVATQNPPNNGTLNTQGQFGVSSNELAGFDISTSNTAYAALKESGKTRPEGRGCGNSTFVTVNLMSGAVTRVGFIGTNQPILGLAAFIAPPPPPVAD